MNLIVADLDGSIVNNNEISANDIKSIEYWISKGNCFTISTGRPFNRIVRFIKELKINLPVTLCNGAAIYTEGQALDILGSIKASDAKSLLNFLKEKQTLENCIIYYGYKTQILRANQKLLHKIAEWDIDYDAIDETEKINNEPVLMISFYRPSSEMTNFLHHYSKQFNIEFSSGNYTDILPKGISKGNALKKALQNFAFNDIYVIGDSINDLSMIFNSNKLVAVENAVYEVKKQASMTIASNKDNPVSDLINVIRRKNHGNI